MDPPYKDPETIEEWKLVAQAAQWLQEQQFQALVEAQHRKRWMKKCSRFKEPLFKALVKLMRLTTNH